MACVYTPQRLTGEEYLRMERAAAERHAYLDGLLYAMAGESLERGTLYAPT